MGDHRALGIEDKDVPFPACAFRRIVVFECVIATVSVITFQRLLHQVYRELLPIHQVNAIVIGRGEKGAEYDGQRDGREHRCQSAE